MSKKVTLIPNTYYKAVKECNGDCTDEKRFDRLAGLSWITKYTFEVVDEKKWESYKNLYKIEVDKQ